MIVKFSNLKTKRKIKRMTKEAKEQLQIWKDDNIPVMFLDECMFTVRSYRTREYAAIDENLSIGASEFGIKPIAFLGVTC